MAGDKDDRTEEPTDKRKSEARKDGQIPRSAELVSWTSIFIGFSALQAVTTKAGHFLESEMVSMAALIAKPDVGKSVAFMVKSIEQSFLLVAPLTLTFLALGIIGHVAQVRFLLTTKPLKPNFKKLNPVNGLKNLFSPQSAFEGAKQVVKLLLLGCIAYMTLFTTITSLSANGPYPIGHIISVTAASVIKFIRFFALTGVLIGLADYVFQRRKIKSSLKMTKQQVKDEAKQADLPPEVRGKIRQKQRQMSRNRMMAAIPKADVVVVNPVHLAIALQYDPQKGAPVVLASGAGFLAEKIRDIADENAVPIVQDIPLARTLHRTCEVGDEIPATLFEAVARVLAFVFALKSRGTGRGFHKMPGTPDLEEADRLEAAKGKGRALVAPRS